MFKAKDLTCKAEDLSLKAKDLRFKAKNLSLKAKNLTFKAKDLSFKAKAKNLSSADAATSLEKNGDKIIYYLFRKCRSRCRFQPYDCIIICFVE